MEQRKAGGKSKKSVSTPDTPVGICIITGQIMATDRIHAATGQHRQAKNESWRFK